MYKNQTITLTMERIGSELEGIGTYEGKTVFVTGALPEETIEAHVLKVHPRYAFAKLVQVVQPSLERQAPICSVYDSCGGCSGQHMTYEATLHAKRMQVFDCLTRIGGLPLTVDDVPPLLACEQPFHSRNKMALPISGSSQNPQIGFYRRRSHSIVPIDSCLIAMHDLSALLATLRLWIQTSHIAPYDEKTQKGVLRHVVVRSNQAGQVMVTIVSTTAKIPQLDALRQALQAKVAGFCSLHISVNKSNSNVILGRTSQHIWGDEVLYENLLGLRFAIAPLSFFQVNPTQTEKLYQKVIEFSGCTSSDVVVDAYAGAGTIALCIAQKVKEVSGIEIVAQAVQSAKCNAEQNHITNTTFYNDAVEIRLPKLVAKGLTPDIIILDPPRKGVEPEVIEAVLQAKPRRIVYVSCHVPTQARDVKSLCEGGYYMENCQPVDMFCYAGGVENVLVLKR